MREIKFRAWFVYGKNMVYDLELIYQRYVDNIGGFKWMQFTGLKDKNGKEIYEGDIVKFSEHYIGDYRQFENIEEIKFEGSGFNDNLNVGYADCPEWCEVIGNIYENPELCDVSKQEGVKDE